MTENADDPESDLADIELELSTDAFAGSLRPLEHYQQRYPEHRERIAAEYQRMSEGGGDRRTSFSMPAEGEFVGPYQLGRRLGVGGQGVVLEATDTRLGRRVALKFLHAASLFSGSRRDRFRREAEVISRLSHPGLCTIYEADLDASAPYIVMPLLEGVPLNVAIRAAKGEPPTENGALVPSWVGGRTTVQVLELVAAFEEVARALHVAHTAGVVHRDIKPGNLFCLADGSLLVLDFGMAHSAESDDKELTASGDRFGTPAYMAPEQLGAGKERVDRRADVYSLGATLYEALTLTRIHDAGSDSGDRDAEVSSHLGDLRSNFKSVPMELPIVLERALDSSLSRRYPSAHEFAEELRRIRLGVPILAQRASAGYRLKKMAQRHKLAFGASLVIVATLILGTGLATWGLVRAKVSEASLIQRNARSAGTLAIAELRRCKPRQALQIVSDSGIDPKSWEGRFLTNWAAGLEQSITVGKHKRFSVDREGDHLIVCGADWEIRLYSTRDGALIRSFRIDGIGEVKGEVSLIQLSNDASSACVSDGNDFWIIPDLAEPRPVRCGLKHVTGVAFDQQSRNLATYNRATQTTKILRVADAADVGTYKSSLRSYDRAFTENGDLYLLELDRLLRWNWRSEVTRNGGSGLDGSGEASPVPEVICELPTGSKAFSPDAAWFLSVEDTETKIRALDGRELATYPGRGGASPSSIGRDFIFINSSKRRNASVENPFMPPEMRFTYALPGFPSVAIDQRGRVFSSKPEAVFITDLTRLVEQPIWTGSLRAVVSSDGRAIAHRTSSSLILSTGKFFDERTRIDNSAALRDWRTALSRGGEWVAIAAGRASRPSPGKKPDPIWLEVSRVDGAKRWAKRIDKSPEALTFSPDGESLAVACGPKVEVIEVETQHTVICEGDSTSTIDSLCFSPTSDRLYVTRSDDSKAVLVSHSVDDGVVAWTSTLVEPARSIACSREGELVALGGDGWVSIVDAQDGQREATIAVNGTVTSLVFLARHEDRLGACVDGRLILIDLRALVPCFDIHSVAGAIEEVGCTDAGDEFWYRAGDGVGLFSTEHHAEHVILRRRAQRIGQVARGAMIEHLLLEEALEDRTAPPWPASLVSGASRFMHVYEDAVRINREVWGMLTGSDLEDFDRALYLAQRAVHLRPDQARIWNTLAYVHYERGEFRECVNALDRAEAINHDADPWTLGQLDGESPLNLMMRSAAYFQLGEFELARKDRRRAQIVFDAEPHTTTDEEFEEWRVRAAELDRAASGGE